MTVETDYDLRTFVLQLIKRWHGEYQGSLEEYLRSLWALINAKKNDPVTFRLFAQLFEDSFRFPSAPFDEEWLNYVDPPAESKVISIFDYLKATILFQIADLRRMQGSALKNELRYLGVESPTGNLWYNFDPFTYLECGTALIEEKQKGEQPSTNNCSWSTLADILEWGRIYE